MRHIYADFIDQVEKPVRYLGGEHNQVVKAPGDVDARIVLAFPERITSRLQRYQRHREVVGAKDRRPGSSRDVLFELGHEIGRTTVQESLQERGIELAQERRIRMPRPASSTRTPGSCWATRAILMDRDPLYAGEFRSLLRGAGVEPVTLPRRSPNLIAHVERFVLSLKRACLD